MEMSESVNVDSDVVLDENGNPIPPLTEDDIIYIDDGNFSEAEDESETLEAQQQIENEQNTPDDDSLISFEGHTDSVYCVKWHPLLPNLVASGGGDDKAFIWDSTTGKSVCELAGHKDSITALGFNRDGKLLATGSYDGTVKIWDSTNGQLVANLEGPSDGIEFISWHPKGNVILGGSIDTTCWMWLSNGTCMNVFGGHSEPVTVGDFTPDGKFVITCSADGSTKLWDPKTAKPLLNIQGHGYHDGPIIAMQIHAATNAIITGSVDSTARIANYSTGKILGTLKGHKDSVEAVGINPSLPYAATASLDKNVNVWDLNTLQLRLSCAHDDGVTRMQWHPKEAPLLISSSKDRTLRMWDCRSGTCVTTWKGHTNTILDFDISADCTRIATGADDQSSLIFKMLEN